MFLCWQRNMEDAIRKAMGFSWMAKVSETEGETVNKNFVVNTDRGKYFIKWNNLPNSKEVFHTEYEGLKLLQNVNVIRIPKPFMVGQVGGSIESFIVLEYLENLQPLTSCCTDFAHALAKLHQDNMTKIAGIRDSAVPYPENSPVTRFGSDEQVFFGPHFCVPGQTWHDQWDQYFSEEMMQPQFTFSQQNLADEELWNLWEMLKPKVSWFFRTVSVLPSLCVGDVGSDNAGQLGNEPVLFDPYCFYGHYEFDLTQPYLTNDFTPAFYDAYFDVMPKEEGYDNRKLLYRLFGCMIRHNYGMDGYLEKAKQTLQELNHLTNIQA